MSATVSTDFLLRVAQATPEQQAAIDRFLSGSVCGSPLRLERRVFSKVGVHWRVIFDDGVEFHLDDTLGARYLSHLLHHPNSCVPAFDLECAVQPEKAAVRSRNSIEQGADPDATRAYLRELGRLRSERERAAADGAIGETERIDGDIAEVEKALTSGARSTDNGERARGNVRKAIAAVRAKLANGGKHEREFNEHLERCLSTGYECVYSQDGGGSWG